MSSTSTYVFFLAFLLRPSPVGDDHNLSHWASRNGHRGSHGNLRVGAYLPLPKAAFPPRIVARLIYRRTWRLGTGDGETSSLSLRLWWWSVSSKAWSQAGHGVRVDSGGIFCWGPSWENMETPMKHMETPWNTYKKYGNTYKKYGNTCETYGTWWFVDQVRSILGIATSCYCRCCCWAEMVKIRWLEFQELERACYT